MRSQLIRDLYHRNALDLSYPIPTRKFAQSRNCVVIVRLQKIVVRVRKAAVQLHCILRDLMSSKRKEVVPGNCAEDEGSKRAV